MYMYYILVILLERNEIYPCEDNERSYQNTVGNVEQGGLLCLLSDPVVCYKKSVFKQTQKFHVSKGGNLVYLDWLVGGVALGELWQMKSYKNETDMYVNGRQVYRDCYDLCDAGHGAMKAHQVVGSCILLGDKLRHVCSNLSAIFGKEKGEQYDPDLTYSISPLHYVVEETVMPGLHIRFMASTTTKAYDSVISIIVEELNEIIGGNPLEDKY